MDEALLLKVLSLAFAYPDRNLANLVVSGALRQDLVALSAAIGLPADTVESVCARMAQYNDRSAEDVMHELRQEYTSLFLGLEPRVPYSEGVWRCRAEGHQHVMLMVNPRSLEVQEFMRSCGVLKADGFNDSVDTVSIECDFAAHLASGPEFPEELGRTAPEAYREFVDSHMKQWIPGFCDDVKDASENTYYLAMVDLLEEFIRMA